MSAKRGQRATAQTAQTTHDAIFQAWCEAAAEYRRVRSDPTEARCRAARAAFYQAVYGEVPPLVPPTPKKSARGTWSDLAPRELAKALLRADSARGMVADPKTPLTEAVKAIRRGGGGAGGGWPDRRYEVQVQGLYVYVRWAQGEYHNPPVRFPTVSLVTELRAEAQDGNWEVAS